MNTTNAKQIDQENENERDDFRLAIDVFFSRGCASFVVGRGFHASNGIVFSNVFFFRTLKSIRLTISPTAPDQMDFMRILCVFVFRWTSSRRGYHLFSIVSFFACTCSNRPGVGAIDNPDRSEQACDKCSMIFVRICSFLEFLTIFKSNFNQYNFYYRKFK